MISEGLFLGVTLALFIVTSICFLGVLLSRKRKVFVCVKKGVMNHIRERGWEMEDLTPDDLQPIGVVGYWADTLFDEAQKEIGSIPLLPVRQVITPIYRSINKDIEKAQKKYTEEAEWAIWQVVLFQSQEDKINDALLTKARKYQKDFGCLNIPMRSQEYIWDKAVANVEKCLKRAKYRDMMELPPHKT